ALVTEVAYASEHHGNATLVSSCDDFFVAYAATRLDHANGASISNHIQTVAEREECVRRNSGALQCEASVFCLDGGNAGGVDAAHLASAYAQCHAVAGEDNGVGFDVFGDFPCELQIAHLLR